MQRLRVTVSIDQLRFNAEAQSRTAAFEAIFLQNYTRVYAVLYRLVGDRAEAQDLTLETFWKLWQQPPARAENIAGWLYRVATRLGYNALRAASRRTHYQNTAAHEDTGEAETDPARSAERSEERVQVRSILARMREREAQLLLLRYSGLSYKEIAAALGVSPNSVGTLLTRAEQEFERLFLEGGPDASER